MRSVNQEHGGRAPGRPPRRLHGRRAELRALGALLEAAQRGAGGALLLVGEPGLGRSALLDRVAAHASGTSGRPAPGRAPGPAGGCVATVLRIRAVAAEQHIPYSGLHALLTPAASLLPAVTLRTAPLAEALRLARPGRQGTTAARGAESARGGDRVPASGSPGGGGRRGAAGNRPAVPPEAVAGPAGARATGLRPGRPAAAAAGTGPGTGAVADALLARLGELTRRGPLLVCVDDAHLLDPDSRAVLGFTARRLDGGPPVALLLSVEQGRAGEPEFAGVPALSPAPLAEPDALALLDDLLPGDAAPAVREALLHEGCGNPSLLTDLVAGLTPAQLTGAAPLPEPLPADGPLLRDGAARLRALPPDTRLLLLLAAVAHECTGPGAGIDADLLLGAARRAGLAGAALEPAETAGVVRTEGDRVRFAHPTLRRVAYGGEPLARRRAAHALLAEVLAARGEAYRLRALRHRAAATDQPDPDLADRLAAAAAAAPGAAHAHGERAAALARAAELTVSTDARVTRLAAAAEHAWLSGRPHRARSLLAAGRELPAREAVRGRAELVRGILELRDGVVTDAREVLLHAARLLEPHDRPAARRALLHAAEAAWADGDVTGYLSDIGRATALTGPGGTAAGDGDAGGRETGDRAAAACAAGDGDGGEHDPGEGRGATGHRRVRTAAAPPARTGAPAPLAGRGPEPHGPAGSALLDAYCDGMRAVMSGRFTDGKEPLRRVIGLGRGAEEHESLIRAGVAALVLGEVGAACEINTRALALARVRGLDTLVPQTLEHLVYAELRAGRHTRAHAHALEGLKAAGRAGQRNCAAHHHAALAMTAALRGDAAACEEHARAAGENAGPHGLGVAATLAVWALALADLGRGLPREALVRLRPLVGTGAGRGHFALRMIAVPDLVEAAVLAGEPGVARAVLPEFEIWTAHTADPQAPAQLARCRALLAVEPAAGEPGRTGRHAVPAGAPAAGVTGTGGAAGGVAAAGYGVPAARVAVSAVPGAESAPQPYRTAGAGETAGPAATGGCPAAGTGAVTAAGTDALFARALELHDLAGGDFQRARTQLLRGKMLRRKRRPGAARDHLRDALVAFERCGAGAWAEQARAELRATGEAGRAAEAPAVAGLLTPQQLRIARCVAEGATNREVALRLSVSPRTVDHHLRNVFAALGIRSRVELPRLLAAAGPGAGTANGPGAGTGGPAGAVTGNMPGDRSVPRVASPAAPGPGTGSAAAHRGAARAGTGRPGRLSRTAAALRPGRNSDTVAGMGMDE
ncbi:LuxR family transcriptional regulator [Streptomyces sp. WAC 00631]|uniref:LuxR family transcriptional regulator n=1 Tax=Streptomyces sp. WAC 00631 TaxID=2203201 RepID=UPI00225E1B65|nr:LuxR family transcriptional regulator [Streptomyces sp. WAC 00631]